MYILSAYVNFLFFSFVTLFYIQFDRSNEVLISTRLQQMHGTPFGSMKNILNVIQ